ncbi:MAG TPA: NAD-dependent protein deacetylase [Kineosporiaceae bacterium]
MTVSPARVTSAGAETVAALVDTVRRGRVVILGGAGLSTESGVPDYRGPTGIARNAQPMTYQEFVGSVQAQRRYWARSYAGWPVMNRVRPNAGHHAVAALQRLGLVEAVITQNVDRLHHAAGSDPVVELHGSLHQVLCLTCRAVSDRATVQERLAEANPGFDVSLFADTDGDTASVRPDGDVALAESMVARFRPVGCLACGGGPLKPDVVFFGENVPKDRVTRCFALVDAAETLLVLGSSLTVMSGYRFVRHARKHGIRVAIVNQGPTRGDGDADLRINARLGMALTATTDALSSAGRPHGDLRVRTGVRGSTPSMFNS